MNRVMAEPDLELVVKHLQLGADLIHGTLIHLHLVDELGNLRVVEVLVRDVERLQTRAQV